MEDNYFRSFTKNTNLEETESASSCTKTDVKIKVSELITALNFTLAY
jgi:hypothetical protein